MKRDTSTVNQKDSPATTVFPWWFPFVSACSGLPLALLAVSSLASTARITATAEIVNILKNSIGYRTGTNSDYLLATQLANPNNCGCVCA